MHLLRILIALTLGMALAQTGPAKSLHLAVSLHAESERPSPGKTTRLAIRFAPEPGWHGYWSNPGDSGLPPKVHWSAPAGLRFGPLRHPAPELLEVAGLASFVHSGTHILLAEMHLPRDIKPGTRLPVQARLEWLACTDRLCVPEQAELSLDLEVGNGQQDAAQRAIFRAATAALPTRATADGTYSLQGGQMLLRLPIRPIDSDHARFYPDQSGILDAAAQRAKTAPDGVEIRLPALARVSTPLTGVVTDGKRSFRVRARLSPAVSLTSVDPVAPAAGEKRMEAPNPSREPADWRVDFSTGPRLEKQAGGSGAGFFTAFLGALIGGLLLNLMPCVFPVLSLKAMSLARSGHSSRAARVESLAYLAGTTSLCLALGVLLLGLRMAGAEVGWAFQLQSPAVLLVLVLLMTAVTANLAGLYHVRGLSIATMPHRGGAIASFSTGALTAIIATPCSAPFMASALGAALLLPPLAGLAVFAGLGVGLGIPFLAIGTVPALRDRLPRPGPWMEKFQRILSVPMALTVVWLLWVLGRQSGPGLVAAALLFALLLLAGLWTIGRQQAVSCPPAWALVTPLTAIVAAALLLVPVGSRDSSAAAQAQSERFSVQRLSQLRNSGQPVFVNFTADWCLACKVNDRIAIGRSGTQTAFRDAGVVTLVGDWTRKDPEITRFLAAHGRNSIPFYLFYAPGREPQALPQVLTPEMLRRLARESAGTAGHKTGSPA